MTFTTLFHGSALAAGIAGVWRETWQRLHASQAPLDDSLWLARLFDSNAAALALIDLATGQIAKASPAFRNLIGSSSDVCIAAARTGTSVEADVIRDGGSPGKVSIRVLRLPDRPKEALVIVADMTESWAARHALESVRSVLEARTHELSGVMSRASAAAEELQRAELSRGRAETILEEQQHAVTSLAARLAATNRELEAFSYSVSHDLRTPLRSIDGFTKALLDHYDHVLDERGRDYLTRVRNATKRMSLLIDDLLKLARISQTTVRWQRVDVTAEARAIIDRLRETYPDRNVDFRAEDDLLIDGDPNLLRIVLDNLLGNAWKFTARRQHAVITVSRRAEDGAICIRDNGAGFDMRYADALFGPFQRLHTSAEFEGTGIGLATVERIISMHGGRISAHAVVDEGATFHFTVRDSIRPDRHHRTNGDETA